MRQEQILKVACLHANFSYNIGKFLLTSITYIFSMTLYKKVYQLTFSTKHSSQSKQCINRSILVLSHFYSYLEYVFRAHHRLCLAIVKINDLSIWCFKAPPCSAQFVRAHFLKIFLLPP